MYWRLFPKISEDFARQFPEYPSVVSQLLYNRGLKTQKEIDEFLNPDFEGDLHDPFLIKGMREAVDKIKKTIASQEKIVIWGDYDVDGICATLILKSTLDFLESSLTTVCPRAKNLKSFDVGIYIPDRAKEGHGLNSNAIKEIKKAGAKLIITVDCGISGFEEVELAKKLGLEVIITDHHQIPGKLPKTKIILNPHQDDDQYPFKNLAGAGVAYKLAVALLKEFSTQDKSILGWGKWLLDLVALATVADNMVFLGENRTLVKYGLIVLNKTQRLGLRELINQSGLARLNFALQNLGGQALKKIDTYEIAFVLAPRLNAAGRMDHANMAYELLSTESEEEARWLVQRLCQLNQERQIVVDKLTKEIESRIGDEKIIFDGGKDWPIGVLGLVAGKICEKYHRPALVFSEESQEIKGACRSIEQFNMVEALNQCASLLLKSGGHPQAAGFSLLKENLGDFKQCLSKAAEKIKNEDLISVLDIDLELNSEDINWQTYEQIQLFSPFGENNPEPVFLLKNLKIKDIRAVGNNGKHLKMELQSSDALKNFKAIGFNFSAEIDKLKIGDNIDIVFEIIVNEWNGFRNLEIKIIDLKKSEGNTF